jgi:hypothetical protein
MFSKNTLFGILIGFLFPAVHISKRSRSSNNHKPQRKAEQRSAVRMAATQVPLMNWVTIFRATSK